MSKNLTDNEIKKALEEQVNDKMCEYQKYEVACGVWCSLKGIPCDDMSGKRRIDNCKEYLPVPYIVRAKATLDLINRLQAENERLTHITRNLIAEIKAEAYKECIEKVKEHSNKMELVCSGALVRIDYTITEEKLDNLLKEKVGEDNGEKEKS